MIDPDHEEHLPPLSAGRLRKGPNGETLFVLNEDGGMVSISDRDIRELQLSAGAIRAGINILLSRAGLTPKDVTGFLIAGGFGGFLRRRSARRIGLIPPGIDIESVEYVGNLSIHGAGRVLVSQSTRDRAVEIAGKTTHVELSSSGDFQSAFAEAMIFPV
jgi:uncharacterized 2Fe-2S/4Fe-4S cluster protein (DUF4445 family)